MDGEEALQKLAERDLHTYVHTYINTYIHTRKTQGFVVTPAMDGEEALQKLAERDYLPDVILLDCQMPKKTGFEVCEELRR